MSCHCWCHGQFKTSKEDGDGQEMLFFSPLEAESGKMIPFDEGSEGSEAIWRKDEKKDGQ